MSRKKYRAKQETVIIKWEFEKLKWNKKRFRGRMRKWMRAGRKDKVPEVYYSTFIGVNSVDGSKLWKWTPQLSRQYLAWIKQGYIAAGLRPGINCHVPNIDNSAAEDKIKRQAVGLTRAIISKTRQPQAIARVHPSLLKALKGK